MHCALCTVHLLCTYHVLTPPQGYVASADRAEQQRRRRRKQGGEGRRGRRRCARPLAPPRLQPYVLLPATLCDGACNSRWRRLQPCGRLLSRGGGRAAAELRDQGHGPEHRRRRDTRGYLTLALCPNPDPNPDPDPDPNPHPNPSPNPSPHPNPNPNPILNPNQVAAALREHLAHRYLPAWPRTLEAPYPSPYPNPHPSPYPIPHPNPHPNPHPTPHPTPHPHPNPRRAAPSSTPSAPLRTPRALSCSPPSPTRTAARHAGHPNPNPSPNPNLHPKPNP
eukprot:scaffold31461_cov50-Phaeocystis_antarctica.AAC.4